jgi:hypothetical protein
MSRLQARLKFGLLAAAANAACLLALAGAAWAQPPTDPGNTTRRSGEAASKQAEADIRLAVREAQRLTATDPAKAVERLQNALAQVDSTAGLSDERRAALKRMLKDRIRVTQLATADPKDADSTDKEAGKGGKKGARDDRAADQDRVRRLLEEIRTLQKQGKLGEGKLRLTSLSPKDADNPAVKATERITSTKDQIASNRQLQADRERGTNDALREVDRTSVIPKGDVEFPKDWKERTKNRSTKPKLTAKEMAIFRGLGSVISVKFKDTHLEDAIEYLQTYLGQPIVLDPLAMEELGLKYDTPVTLSLNRVTLRTVLTKVVRDLGLAYVIKDEVIQVTTPKKAQDMMVTHVYSIADLARDPLEAAILIDLIQSTVDPGSWKDNGGTGTIVYHPLTQSLVIKQSSEFHAAMSNTLH